MQYNITSFVKWKLPYGKGSYRILIYFGVGYRVTDSLLLRAQPCDMMKNRRHYVIITNYHLNAWALNLLSPNNIKSNNIKCSISCFRAKSCISCFCNTICRFGRLKTMCLCLLLQIILALVATVISVYWHYMAFLVVRVLVGVVTAGLFTVTFVLGKYPLTIIICKVIASFSPS